MGHGDNGSRNTDEEVTPVEAPQATLAVHRPYVLSLFRLCSEVETTNRILAGILHTIRVAEEPITDRTVNSVGDALSELSASFGSHAANFRK